MSHVKASVMQALQRMNGAPALIRDSDASFMMTIQSVLRADEEDEYDDVRESRIVAERHKNLCAAYGMTPSTTRKPFAYADGVAIIPIHGSLINRYGGYWYGMVTGYNFIRSQMNAALADPDVEAIIYDVNSNGGEAAGCFELSNEIYASRDIKPSYAVVDSNAYSAAYALGSAATKMSVTPSGGAGSIGVIAMHMDLSKLLDDIGIKVSIVKSGQYKADGNPYEELSDETRARWQADIDAMRGDFVALVAQNRDLEPKVVHDTEAMCYNAADALSIGLIDAILPPAAAVAEFLNGPSGGSDDQTGANAMTYTQEELDAACADAAAKASAEATTAATAAERTRISGILGCEAATGRTALASHIAFNTAMSVEDAGVMLGAAGVEQAPAPTKPEKGADEGRSPFGAVMDNAKHPEMGAEQEEGRAEDSGKADGLMAAMQGVAGESFIK